MPSTNRKKTTTRKNRYSKRSSPNDIEFYSWRFISIILGFLVIIGLLISRMVYLTIYDRAFLEHQGNARTIRVINIPAYRGMILDRNNSPLAVSTPVDSVWVNPKDFPDSYQNLNEIASILHLPFRRLNAIVKRNGHREFVYIRRNVNPILAKQIQQLSIPGVYLEKSFRRYYPQGEVAAHVVGFTNIDDIGESGLELAYNKWLQGTPGKEKVVKDRYGRVVAVISDISRAKPGHDLILSIDNRIQFLAYRVLKATVKKFKAESGSVVVLNPNTGEILAMVNQPSFNPNLKPSRDYGEFRNRAVTDMFEPGSTMKAFSVLSALDSGKYYPDTKIDTNPGWIMIGKNKVHDEHFNHGLITVTEVLQKSSNVGVAKMTLSLPPEHFMDVLRRVGFGQSTNSGFPGESTGTLIDHPIWRPFVLATLAYGYGISVTPIQLAAAYGVIANHGKKCPVTFLKRDDQIACPQVVQSQNANHMLTMLESVMRIGGTGLMARVKGYRIAGKTGTAYIAGQHGYDKSHHMASFVGIAPVSDPQLVVAVIVRNPKTEHYGGLVAAPAFSKIMGGALRDLDIAPDDTKNG